MAIHAYYGDISHLKNEKKMFDDLLTQLKLHWEYSEDWIYLFYNTMWSGQEIDVIAITKESIFVIDLKNYSGDLSGSENGEWLINDELEVQGGSQINPFVQVRKNKFAVLEWFKKAELFANQNLAFISGCIILNQLSSRNIDLSQSVSKWFYVTDIANSVDTLARVKSKGINFSNDDILYLVNKLKLKEYSWDRNATPRDITKIISNESPLSDAQVGAVGRYYDENLVPIKYTLHDQVEKQYRGAFVKYAYFFVTLLICLAISFYIANQMSDGHGMEYLFKLLHG